MSFNIGLISIKGGVGKTTASSNLASALANQFNKKVLLVDANFSAPNVGLHYGIVSPTATLHDVLTNKAKIKDVIVKTEHGIDVLPGRLNFKGQLPFLKIKDELKKISDDYDYIIIDSSPNLNSEMLATMISSDVLFAVSTPDYPTLSCTMHAVKIARERKSNIVGIILNRVYNKDFELSLDEIEDSAECPVVAVIPHNVGVVEALSKTMPAHSHMMKEEGTIEYNKLAAAIVKEDYKDPRLMSQLVSFFSKTIPKQDVNRNTLRK